MKQFVQKVAIIVPRLDFFAKSEWLVYGVKAHDAILLYAAQGLIFIPILLLVATVDFNKRKF